MQRVGFILKVRKDKIGFVFQAFNLLPRTNVLRNVVLPLVYADVPEHIRAERAKKALLSAGLVASRLSSREFPRDWVARCILGEPPFCCSPVCSGGRILLSRTCDWAAKCSTTRFHGSALPKQINSSFPC